MDAGIATRQISSILDRLSQGALEDDDLDKLLKDATSSSDSAERQYLFQVLANLYPHRQLPHPNSNTHAVNVISSPQLRRALTDKTNRLGQHVESGSAQQGSSTAKPQPLAPQNTDDPKTGSGQCQASEVPAAVVQGHHAQVASSSPLSLQAAAAGVAAAPLLATTDQLAALVTAATTAATKAVARTILYHSRTAKTQPPTTLAEEGLQQQQISVSSRLQPLTADPHASESAAAAAAILTSKPQPHVQDEEQSRTLLPTQQLLKFATVGQGGSAAAHWYIQRQQAPPTEPQQAAPSSTVADAQSSVIKYPRIWVRPDEEQLQQQEQQPVQDRQLPKGAVSPEKEAAALLEGAEARTAPELYLNQSQQTAVAVTTDVTAENTNNQQHSLQKGRRSSGYVAPAKASIAVQADKPETVDQAVQAQSAAANELPAATPQPPILPQQQQDQQSVAKQQQPQAELTQQPKHAGQQQMQYQLEQGSQQPASPQQQRQPAEPVVPSSVPLPPELHTAVERTLQSFREPMALQHMAAAKPSWQQQPQQPDEATRAVQCMLGGSFDYRQAANQLSQAASAVQHLVSAARDAGRRFNSSSGSMPLPTVGELAPGDVACAPPGGGAAAAAGAEAAWPAVLGDVMPPLTKFYEQEDAWQDVVRFGQAVEKEVAWRLAAAAAGEHERRNTDGRSPAASSGRAVTFASTPKKAALLHVKSLAKSTTLGLATAAQPAAGLPQGTPQKSPGAATGAPSGSRSLVKQNVQAGQPAAAHAGASAYTGMTATPGPFASKTRQQAAAGAPPPEAQSKPRPAVAFGRRVDKPLAGPTPHPKQYTIISSSRVTSAVRAAQGLQPSRELPCFVDSSSTAVRSRATRTFSAAGAAGTALHMPGRSERTAATAAALQRLANRRRSAAAAVAAGNRAAFGVQKSSLGGGDAQSDVLDVLLEAVLEAQREQQQQLTEQEEQQMIDSRNKPMPQSHHLGTQQQQQQWQHPEQHLQSPAGTVPNSRSRGRQFSAFYDLTEPYPPALPAAQQLAAASRHMAEPQHEYRDDSPQQQQSQHWQEQQQQPLETAGAASLNQTPPSQQFTPAAARIVEQLTGTAAGSARAAVMEQGVMDLLVDEVMGQLLLQNTAAAHDDAQGAASPTSTSCAADGSAAAAQGVGADLLNHHLLRELIAEELTAALDVWLSEEAGAANDAAAARTSPTKGSSIANSPPAAAAAAAAGGHTSSEAHLGTAETPERDEHWEGALLHALTEALLSTGLVKPAAGAVAPHSAAAIAAIPGPNNEVGNAAAVDAVGPAAVSPSRRSNADIKASIAKLRVKSGRHKERMHGFGHLPGLHRAAGAQDGKQQQLVATGAARADGDGDGGVQMENQATGIVLGDGEQLLKTVGRAGTEATSDSQSRQQQQQQQQQLSARRTQPQLAGASLPDAEGGNLGPASVVLLSSQGHQQQQQQPAYVLVPVSMLDSFLHVGQVQPLQQPAVGQPTVGASTTAGISRPESPPAAYGMLALPEVRDAAAEAAFVDGSLHQVGTAADASWKPWPGSQIQQLQQQQAQDNFGLPGQVGSALQPVDDTHADRLSLPGSECFRDSSDSFSSSIASSRMPVQHVQSEAKAANIHTAVAAAGQPPWQLRQAPAQASGDKEQPSRESEPLDSAAAAAASPAEEYADDFEAEEGYHDEQQQEEEQQHRQPQQLTAMTSSASSVGSSSTSSNSTSSSGIDGSKGKRSKDGGAAAAGCLGPQVEDSFGSGGVGDVLSEDLEQYAEASGLPTAALPAAEEHPAAAEGTASNAMLAATAFAGAATELTEQQLNLVQQLSHRASSHSSAATSDEVSTAAAAAPAEASSMAPAEQQQRTTAAEADVSLPQLVMLSSSSSSSGGSKRHPVWAAAAGAGDSAAANVRLWRPPRQAVAAATAEQTAVAVTGATAAAGLQQHLVRFPLSSATTSATPAGNASVVAAPAAAPAVIGTSSPGWSSLVGMESSTATLTTISTSGNTGSSSGSTDLTSSSNSSLDWSALEALGIASSANTAAGHTAAAAAAGPGDRGTRHGAVSSVQVMLSGRGGHIAVQQAATVSAAQSVSAEPLLPSGVLRQQKLQHLVQRQQQSGLASAVTTADAAAAPPGWVGGRFVGGGLGVSLYAAANMTPGGNNKLSHSLTSSVSSSGSSSSGGDSNEGSAH